MWRASYANQLPDPTAGTGDYNDFAGLREGCGGWIDGGIDIAIDLAGKCTACRVHVWVGLGCHCVEKIVKE